MRRFCLLFLPLTTFLGSSLSSAWSDGPLLERHVHKDGRFEAMMPPSTKDSTIPGEPITETKYVATASVDDVSYVVRTQVISVIEMDDDWVKGMANAYIAMARKQHLATSKNNLQIDKSTNQHGAIGNEFGYESPVGNGIALRSRVLFDGQRLYIATVTGPSALTKSSSATTFLNSVGPLRKVNPPASASPAIASPPRMQGQNPVKAGPKQGRLRSQPANFFTNTAGAKMLLIPSGSFDMGSNLSEEELKRRFKADKHNASDEFPLHRVTISSFYMSQTEVTVAQFRKFISETKYTTDAERDGKGGFGLDPKTGRQTRSPTISWKQNGLTTSDDHPVINVSWNDAVKYCEWLSRKEGRKYAMPTEAQWEYACRANTKTIFQSGDDPISLSGVGNIKGTADGFERIGSVASLEANKFGLHDMHGNVLEWCSDRYSADYYKRSPTADPTGPSEGSRHVVRGGGWMFGASTARSALRSKFTPGFRGEFLGFRVAMQVQ